VTRRRHLGGASPELQGPPRRGDADQRRNGAVGPRRCRCLLHRPAGCAAGPETRAEGDPQRLGSPCRTGHRDPVGGERVGPVVRQVVGDHGGRLQDQSWRGSHRRIRQTAAIVQPSRPHGQRRDQPSVWRRVADVLRHNRTVLTARDRRDRHVLGPGQPHLVDVHRIMIERTAQPKARSPRGASRRAGTSRQQRPALLRCLTALGDRPLVGNDPTFDLGGMAGSELQRGTHQSRVHLGLRSQGRDALLLAALELPQPRHDLPDIRSASKRSTTVMPRTPVHDPRVLKRVDPLDDQSLEQCCGAHTFKPR